MSEQSLHPEYRTFIRLLRLLAYYAPEQSDYLPSASGEDPDEEFVREHFRDLHLISQDDYLEYIYTRRTVEDNLRKEFLLSPNLAYLIGPLGSGKTSLSLSLRKSLTLSTLHPCYLAYIDVRQALGGRNQLELAGSDLREFLRQLVMDKYRHDLFQYKKCAAPDRNPCIQLWAFLLDWSSQPPEARGVSEGLAHIQTRAALLFDGYSSPKLAQDENPSYTIGWSTKRHRIKRFKALLTTWSRKLISSTLFRLPAMS